MDIAAFHRHGKSEAQMQDHKSFCELPILATELESRTCVVSKTSTFETNNGYLSIASVCYNN